MAVHPRDHVFAYTYQGASTQTDVTLVTLKVRVNGGAATTYTNVSTPAVTQNADCNFGYRLEIPANTYADGDKVERTWLYNSVAQAYGEDVIGLAEVDGAHYTAARGDKLDELDAAAAFSTRSGTAQSGAASSITLDAGASSLNDFYVGQWVVIASGAGAGQSRLITSYVGSTKVATVHSNWKTQPSNTSVFYLLAAADIQGVVLADTATTLTNAPADSAGTTTLLARLTSTRAGLLDFLDAAISSRLATAGYTAPDNADVVTILADVVTLLGNATTLLGRIPSDVWDEAAAGHTTAGTFGLLMAYLDASVASRLATSGYTAPDNSDVVTILADVAALIGSVNTLLARIPGDILDEVVTGHNAANSVGKLLQFLDAAISSRSTYAGADTAGTTALLALLTPTRAAYLDNLVRLDAAITTRLATSGYTAPDNADVVTILADVALLLARLPADVWDELLANHTTTGTAGKALGSLGAASDPWAVPLPGAYSGSEAGEILALIKAKTDLLGAAKVTVTSPVANTGRMNLIAGDDYKAADGRAITFTIDPAWPSLAGATVTLKIGTEVTAAGTIGSTTLSFDLPKAQTAKIAGTRHYEIVAALANGSIATLVVGTCAT